MQTKYLQPKRVFCSVLLVLLLFAAGMTKMYASYDFSAVCSTGQTLYYNITDATNHYVELTCPGSSGYSYCWSGYTKPTGNIILPESVQYDGTTYSMTSIGDYAFCYCSGLTGSLTIPNLVTTIGSRAFYACSGFTGNLTIGNSVTTIGSDAFRSCSGFTGLLTIPNSVTIICDNAFEYCTGFTGSLTISNFLTEIGYRVFANCSGFTGSLTIPNSVTSIKSYAFSGCSSITDISIPSSVISIGNGAFAGTAWYNNQQDGILYASDCCLGYKGPKPTGELCLQPGIRLISDRALYSCADLTGSLTIPNSVTLIGSYAFFGCSGFTGSLIIPNSVTSIGSYAFFGCNGFMGSLNIPNSVISIGSYGFSDCSGITDISIPSSVTSIGGSAFEGTAWYNNQQDGVLYVSDCCLGYKGQEPTGDLCLQEGTRLISGNAFFGCSGFTGSLTIPNSVTSIGSQAFAGCSGFTGSLTISNSVTKIGNKAFSACSGFTGSLTIPNSVTYLGLGAFEGCSGFTGSLTIPNSVIYLGTGAFSGCSGFTGSLTISNSVSEIGPCAFRNCNSFTSMTIQRETPPVIYYDPYNIGSPFEGWSNSIPVYVPCGSVSSYQSAAYWNYFTNYQEIESFTVAASANPTEGGSIEGAGSYLEGETCTLVATANANYVFLNWTENDEVVSTNSTYSFTVTSDRTLVANFNEIVNHWEPEISEYEDNMTLTCIVQIDGVEQTSATLELGAFCGAECRGSQFANYFAPTNRYIFQMTVFGESNDVISFRLYDHLLGQEVMLTPPATVTFNSIGYGSLSNPYVLNFTSTITHIQALNSGWNWWSTYIELTDNDGLNQLENSIGEAGIMIKSRTNGYVEAYEYNGTTSWFGTLSSINNEQMYKIRTNAACNATIEGLLAVPANHSITINSGWNWIGFPCNQDISVDVAMSGFIPENEDIIKSRNGFTTYYSDENYNMWYGTLNTLEPGKGYMYRSNSATQKTLVFQTSRSETTMENVTTENNIFQPADENFADNMTITAVLEIDGEELRLEDYELAAFVGDECRGSVKLMYVEPVNRYVAFLTVFGESSETLYFRLTDGTQTELSMDEINFVADGMTGTLSEPMTLRFGMTQVDENRLSKVLVYPNPSNGLFNVQGQGIRKIEIFNSFGQAIVSEEVSNDYLQIDLSRYVDGCYMLRVVTDNGITNNQLIKK